MESSAVSHIWRKSMPDMGHPGFAAVRQKQIPFGNDRKKGKGDAFAPVEMTKLGVIANQAFLNPNFHPPGAPGLSNPYRAWIEG